MDAGIASTTQWQGCESETQLRSPSAVGDHDDDGCCCLAARCAQEPLLEPPQLAAPSAQARHRQVVQHHILEDGCSLPEGAAAVCSILEVFGADATRAALLGACTLGASASIRATCRELADGTLDGQGRLLAASALLPSGTSVPQLRLLSPHLLQRLVLPSAAGEEVLGALASLRHELIHLREVSVHLAAPRLPRLGRFGRGGAPGQDSQRAASVLARAVTLALPPSVEALSADLRGGCSLSGDIALVDFSSAIPRSLVRLRLDLNRCSAKEIQAVSRALSPSLTDFQLVFHGRSFGWGLNTAAAAAQEDHGVDGLEALSRSLPSKLKKLNLRLECTDVGGKSLCEVLPRTLQELHLDLLALKPPHGSPAEMPKALARALPPLLVSLQLRLVGWSLPLPGVKLLAQHLPPGLRDLRLDVCGRGCGNEGALALAEALPKRLSQLALCLRSWRFGDEGAQALAQSIPTTVRCLMLSFSGNSAVGVEGARAIASSLPPHLEVLNLSLDVVGLGPEGEEASLEPLRREWSQEPSWVRFRDASGGSCAGVPEEAAEWACWGEFEF